MPDKRSLAKEEVYNKMDSVMTRWYRQKPDGIPWWNFYDLLEVFEEDLPARDFKEVAIKLARKWYPEVSGEVLEQRIYPSVILRELSDAG